MTHLVVGWQSSTSDKSVGVMATHRTYINDRDIWKPLSFQNATSRPLCIHSKFWMMAFLVKTSQHFISEWKIHYILGWNMYHLLNHVVKSNNPFFPQNKYFSRRKIMNTNCCSFIFSLGKAILSDFPWFPWSNAAMNRRFIIGSFGRREPRVVIEFCSCNESSQEDN